YALARNRPAIEPHLARLGRALGLAAPGFDGVLDWILDLRRALGIPKGIAALGVAEEHMGTLARRAAADPSAASNPLPFGQAEYALLLRDALATRLAI
ncbi:MAG: iron-containing alcohol dehydrogenase, partial [Geminicoccales bacterium]